MLAATHRAALLLVGLAALALGARAVETHVEQLTQVDSGRIPTVDAVDIEAYAGRWFQVYANALVKYTFELGGTCVTADYGKMEDGISVRNAQNMWKPNGTVSTIEGRAFAPNASEPGKLQVEFDSVPFPGSYWIVKLGPVEGGRYQYSVVTDRFGFTLFILARDVAGFKERFEQEVLDFVTPLFQGFLRRPLPTVQGPDCLYSVEAVGEEEAGESGQVRVPQLLVAPQPAEEVARRQAHLRTSPK